MTVFIHVLTAVVPLFALIFLGYFAKKIHLLHVTDVPALNRFVLSISLPAFIFNALVTHKLQMDLLQLPFVFWIAEGAMVFVALGVGKALKWERPAMGTLLLQSLFGNTGYIGYPMCTALMPMRLPGAVIIDQFGMSIPLYPSAPYLGTVYGTSSTERSLKEKLSFLRTPAFIALALGILLKFVPRWMYPSDHSVIEVGKIVMQIIAMIGGATIPVVLVAIGVILRPSSLGVHGKGVLVIGLLKLVTLPVMVWLISRFLFHITGSLLAVCIMEAATPPSATSTVFAGQYNLDSGLAIASFFALTVLSAITLPIMLGLLR